MRKKTYGEEIGIEQDIRNKPGSTMTGKKGR